MRQGQQSQIATNLQAYEFPAAQNNPYNQPQQYYGQSNQGAPVYPAQLAYQIQQPPLNYQQVIYQGHHMPPTIIIASPQVSPQVQAELQLRSAAKFFYGFNGLCGTFIFILLIVRCVVLVESGDAAVAAAVMLIISNVIFVFAAVLGIYAISRNKEHILLYYQYFMGAALIFELIGSIIVFSNGGKAAFNVVAFIILMIIIILLYGMFIRKARNIRIQMQFIKQMALQQQPDGGVHNQANQNQYGQPILIQP